MEIKAKLDALRAQMKKHSMAAYIIPTNDFHGSEYVGSYFKCREFMSGFTGSAGTLVVRQDGAELWTDGRYFLQAAAQLEGSTITLMKDREPGVPTIEDFLAKELPKGSTIGFDGRTVSPAFVNKLLEKGGDKKFSVDGSCDLVDVIWKDRPEMSMEPVWELDTCYTGLSRAQKLEQVREKMKEQKADALVLTSLEEIAWLLNLRGNDVRCTPVFLAYMVLTQDKATLCVHKKILSRDLTKKLKADGVKLADYDQIGKLLKRLPSRCTIWADSSHVNYQLMNSLPRKAAKVDSVSPIELMKAIKTPEEIANIKEAHIKDGVAVTRFIHWLQENVGKEKITELTAVAKIEAFRAEQEGFIEPSFDSIISFADHGAIVHYAPTPESDVEMEPRSFCLADTGGHYKEGSTDITRTIPLGTLTEEEKRMYTLVLKGHLNLGAATFIHGCCGQNLDYLAREPLWENGLDYNHGTGHGVGYILSVHEGPQRIHWRITANAAPVVLEEGMVISNEPGIYLEDKFGIRHENLVLCCKGQKNSYGQFMHFENLTMVPFDRNAIDRSLLSERDITRLNAYHKQVYETLAPRMTAEEQEWLAEMTKEL